MALMALALIIACATAPPEEETTDAAKPATHTFEEVAPGVYFVQGTGEVNVGSNSMVVVNEEDVLVVDSHITPDAARELVVAIAGLTDKPIKTLVNTHFHYDHANGNQIFGDGIEIIGHEYTRQKLLTDVLSEPTYVLQGSVEALTPRLEQMEAQLAASEGDARADLEKRIAVFRRHISAQSEVVLTPPERTLTDSLTLEKGSRTIELQFLGRGHTAGDLVIYLPTEKVVYTGDLFYDGAPYLADGFPLEFIDALEKLKGIDAEIILGGHGGVTRDKSRIDARQEYLRDYWAQAKASHDAGLSPANAFAKLDLEKHGFGSGRPAIRQLEIERMYHLMDGGE
jgi:glyoxylase-like metal-dependent hydrolase (beta-lactamase superfamily II)